MDLVVRNGIKFCSAGARTVFLDVSSGRYFLLAGDASLAFQRWSNRELLDLDDLRLLKQLIDRRFLTSTDECGASGSTVGTDPIPPQQDLRVSIQRPSPSLVGYAILQRLIWTRRVRKWPLSRIIDTHDQLERNSRSLRQPGSVGIHQVARAFEHADLLLGNHDRCLERTLALAAVCRKNGISAQIVIAVQMNPFAAHAWAQHDNIVLNERVDRARLFKPILAF